MIRIHNNNTLHNLDLGLRSVLAPLHVGRIQLGALSMATSGILFVLYPALRPFSDEKSLQGAEAFASSAWVVAHVLAMFGFILLAWALLSLNLALQETDAERLSFRALVVCWIGIGLTLPFYGAEAFGLHAIGQAAVQQHSTALIALVDDVRSGPGLTLFGIGLVVLAIGVIMAASAIWKSRIMPKWSGVPLALGFALYIPQFYGTQPVRVAHGLLIAVGSLCVAASMWHARSRN
jgi:hypothetical protein